MPKKLTSSKPKTSANEKTSGGRSAPPCSGSLFEWIAPGDRRWAEWCAWDEKILVLTSDGPCVVRVPEDGFPSYVLFDEDEEIADPEEWKAWARIPRLQNVIGQARRCQALI